MWGLLEIHLSLCCICIKIAWVSETIAANNVVMLDIVSLFKPKKFLKDFGAYLFSLLSLGCTACIVELLEKASELLCLWWCF